MGVVGLTNADITGGSDLGPLVGHALGVNIDNGYGAAVAAVRMASLTMADRPVQMDSRRTTEVSQEIHSSVE